jgi:exodeoxyribonuclease III
MKIVTWNCQGAFRKKFGRIARATPDLAVIQECEHPDKLKWRGEMPAPTHQLWFGKNANRGLGIFSWSDLEFSPDECYDPSIQYCVPVKVSGGCSFNLLAVWAMQHTDPRLSYIAQVNLAIITYHSFIEKADTVLMGDLNSNQHQDALGRLGSHDWVVRALADLDLVSAYHYFHRETQGRESQSTFFMNRKIERPFHLDYVFIPRRWLKKLGRVRVGKPQVWLKYSDHCPVFLETLETPPA